MPPDRPTRVRRKAGLADVIAGADDQGLVHLLHFVHRAAHGRFGGGSVAGASVVGYADDGSLANLAQDVGVLLARTGIPQALAKYRIDVQIGDDEPVLEGWATGDDRPIRTAYDAGAVEDQFVLPADGVEVGNENAVVGGAGGDHALALGGLAGVEG